MNYYSSIGIDTASPMFGWQLESEQQDQQENSHCARLFGSNSIC